MGAARNTKTGLIGYAIAIGIGLALGGSFTWTLWTVGKRVASTMQGYQEAQQKLYSGAVLLAVVAWLLIAVLVTDSLTSLVMRAIG